MSDDFDYNAYPPLGGTMASNGGERDGSGMVIRGIGGAHIALEVYNMVHPSKQRALVRRAPNTVRWLSHWIEQLRNEMQAQGADPNHHIPHSDDSASMTLERGKVRMLLRGMIELRADIQRFSN